MPLHENSRELATEFPYDELDGEPAPQPSSHAADSFEFARRLVSYVRSQPRARLTVDCLYLALGDAELEGETMTTVGARHGITKAAVSKRVGKIRADLHLPLSFNNKSAHASRQYALTNRSPLRLDRPSPGGGSPGAQRPRHSR